MLLLPRAEALRHKSRRQPGAGGRTWDSPTNPDCPYIWCSIVPTRISPNVIDRPPAAGTRNTTALCPASLVTTVPGSAVALGGSRLSVEGCDLPVVFFDSATANSLTVVRFKTQWNRSEKVADSAGHGAVFQTLARQPPARALRGARWAARLFARETPEQ